MGAVDGRKSILLRGYVETHILLCRFTATRTAWRLFGEEKTQQTGRTPEL